MSLPAGASIGPYEILEALGAGGMGEVYRARDVRLQRFVAIKVLLAEHARDPDLPGRLEREALILASLNHPGIATVLGIETYQGSPAVVMELVEGESLADRCRRGSLPLPEVLRIARRIADALSFAHDRDVVHRDLKPANIRIRPDGAVKVLDFGLARGPFTADTGSGPVSPGGLTRTGAVLGTVPYMSPEQLRGQAFDRRADIWAFGCTVFEMLTGRTPFARATEVDTITAILQDEPDWTTLPADTPPGLRGMLERCLQKNPSQRLRDVADARFDEDYRSGALSGPVAPLPRRLDRVTIGAVVAIVAVTAAVLLLPAWWRGDNATGGALRKFEVVVAGLGEMPGTYVGESGPGAGVSISPDGRRIVYPREGHLWLRDLSQIESREIEGTAGAGMAAWSPDGESLAFAVANQVKRLPTRGGTPITVTTASGNFVEAGSIAWAPNGILTFTNGNNGIYDVPAQGGDPRLIVPQGPGERDFHDLMPLPDGRGTLFITHLTSGQYAIEALVDGERRALFGPRPQVIRHAVYSTTGHLLYQRVDRNPGIWAVPVDAATMKATGEPFLVAASGLRPSLATDGTLVFVTDEMWGLLRLSLVDRAGAVLRDIGEPVRGLRHPALSKDGARIAVMVQGSQHDDLWTYDVASGQATQITTDGARGDPAWDPTGQHLAYSCGATSREGGICVRDAQGGGEPVLTVPRASMASYAPDGLTLVHVLLDPVSRTDIFRTRLSGSDTPALMVRSEAFEYNPRVSPDGRYMVYGTAATGRPDVFITTFPDAKGKWQVSPDSGAEPKWNPAGGELFYVDAAGRLQAVPLNADGRMPPGSPRPLFDEQTSHLRLTDGYEPTARGESFVVVRDADRAKARPRITVVQNWFTEFRTP